MTSKTDIWDRLGKTDPRHTQTFKRAGGFSGTAIKPMWAYRRMTEEFGPCGQGWGVNAPSFQVVPGNGDETLVFCTVSIWYETREQVVYGVGGDKAIVEFKNGTRARSDDEAFKKAFTDGITNALKLIGVGADVHMGMFDDNKYVNSLKEEFAGKTSSAELKRQDVWPQFIGDLDECRTIEDLNVIRGNWRQKARNDRYPAAWLDAMAEELEKTEIRIRDFIAPEPNSYAEASQAPEQTIISAG